MNAKKVIGMAMYILLAGTALVTACDLGDDAEAEAREAGVFKTALSGISSQGYTYRLREARFDLTGPESRSFSSEDYLEQATILVELAVGEYQVALWPDWVLERSDNGAFTPVEATLQSENTLAFVIDADQTTGVLFLFRVGDDVVPIGEGSLSIAIGIDDNEAENTEAACADGIDNDADGAIDCEDADCNGTQTCGLCGDGVASGTEVCDGADIGTTECADFGFTGGNVSCNASCSNIDLSLCTGGPQGWTCQVSYYGGGDGCDCGCGSVDPDCGNAEVDSCQFCGNAGSCNSRRSSCPGNLLADDNASCLDPVCGDGIVSGPEKCEGDDLRGETCTSLSVNFTGGNLACSPSTCAFDTTGCIARPEVCGDGIISGDELCDGAIINGTASCAQLNYSGGTLVCNAICDNYDLSDCEGGAEVPAGWTCPAFYYGATDGCDCGCGVMDPDCTGTSAADCQYCADPGACNRFNTGCPGGIDTDNNAVCSAD